MGKSCRRGHREAQRRAKIYSGIDYHEVAVTQSQGCALKSAKEQIRQRIATPEARGHRCGFWGPLDRRRFQDLRLLLAGLGHSTALAIGFPYGFRPFVDKPARARSHLPSSLRMGCACFNEWIGPRCVERLFLVPYFALRIGCRMRSEARPTTFSSSLLVAHALPLNAALAARANATKTVLLMVNLRW